MYSYGDRLNDEQKAQLEALVQPWLPGAEVESSNIQTCCGCYSDWTQEWCRAEVTFELPWDESDDELSKRVSAVEYLVKRWISENFRFSGGVGCCVDEDGDSDDPPISFWVRAIPRKP